MSMSDPAKYPERVNLLSGTRRINFYGSYKKITTMRHFIGADAYDEIKNNSQVGVILKLAECGLFLSFNENVGALLSNMLVTDMPHELWVLAHGRPIRFSLHEFEHFTHLKCGLYDGNDEDFAYRDIWTELGIKIYKGPNWNELNDMVRKCGHWSLAKRTMVGLLVVLHVGILGLHRCSRIPINLGRLVTDRERFERHPWGRVSFGVLIRSILLPCERGEVKILHGLVPVLQVWALEHIPLLQWRRRSSRGFPLEDVCEDDKVEIPDRKVRVVHLVEKPYVEIYPEWPGDGVDPKVDRMIRDILGGKLDETFWQERSGLIRGLLKGRPLRSIVSWEARRRERGRNSEK